MVEACGIQSKDVQFALYGLEVKEECYGDPDFRIISKGMLVKIRGSPWE